MLRPLMLALLGTSFTFLMTALGAATVFFFARKVCERAQGALLGFAAGVMMAASVWSLILPAIEQTEAEGRLPPFLPAAAGIVLGALTLFLLDELVRRRGGGEVHSDFLLLSAITLHNIPEGMAVGLAFALAADGESLAGAFALALGAVVFIGMMDANGFQAMFVGMHRLIFTNDNWLLNPATDMLIRMMPQNLFETALYDVLGQFARALSLSILLLAAAYAVVSGMVKRQLTQTEERP